jgi:hypothetical protein
MSDTIRKAPSVKRKKTPLSTSSLGSAKRRETNTFEERDDGERRAFVEWINDDKNLGAVVREMERQGLLESFVDDDGRIQWRRTAKQTYESSGGDGSLDS